MEHRSESRNHDPNANDHSNRSQSHEAEVSRNYTTLAQLVRSLQDDVAEMKASHHKEIAEMKTFYETEISQMKASIESSHNKLNAASEVMYSEMQASSSQSKNEFALIHQMILELRSSNVNNNYHGSNNNSSAEFPLTIAQQQQQSLTITDGTGTSHSTSNQDVSLSEDVVSGESSPPFGQILGPTPIAKLGENFGQPTAIDEEQQNVLARLKNLESLVDPPNQGNAARFLKFDDAVGGGGGNDDDDEMEDLEEDIYSLIFVSAQCNVTFFFSIMVSLGQFFISALIIIDILDENERPFDVLDDNPYRLPAKVGWQVACAQFAALIIAFVTQKEVITCAKMMLVGYDPNVQKISPGATYGKFILSNLLRFSSGLITIFVSVLIIMQSADVLEIFMNFAAVAFVSDLDNIAFETAKDGLLGRTLKGATERVEITKMKVQKKNNGWMIDTLFVILFIPFLLGLLTVRVRQSNGFLLAETSCKGLHVHFGDEQYQLPAGVNFTFVGEGVNKTFPGSTRKLPFLHDKPPDLLFQYFSGRYVAEQGEGNERLIEYHSRPIYWERGIKDPTSGKFYYCDKIKSWVFTIEAIYNTPGAMPQEAIDECRWGWLMQSPETDTITLDTAPGNNWKVWTGRILDLEDSATFSISCTDCKRDTDCGLEHGYCVHETGTCLCHEGWQGVTCNVEAPFCEYLGWVMHGNSAYDYFEYRRYKLSELEFYERPVYYNYWEDNVEMIMYTGRRWFDMFWTFEDLAMADGNFHAYWDNVFDRNTKWYTNPTENIFPNRVHWYEIQDSKSKGSFGPFGYSIDSIGSFECLQVDCISRPSLCGVKGKCVERTETFVNLNTTTGFEELKRYNCECIEDFGGYYCERDPNGPYAADMYKEYTANPKEFLENNKNLTYPTKYFGTKTLNNTLVQRH